ncbi:hypothetical protein GC170_07235 [bacterium]|nr:hypothetical protein [bacterium]
MNRFCRISLLLLSLWSFGAVGRVCALDYVLYDASLGTLPGTQPWLFYGAAGTATQTLDGTSGTRLTTDLAAQAGWSNTIPVLNTFKNAAFPTLSSSDGFAIDWSMQMIAESHSSGNRAGTSMILLGSDNKGIEIGFWTDQIWAQTSDPLFTKGESTNFVTTASAVNYRLLIKDSSYYLFANDAEILSGQTRSYAAFGSAPYTLSNYFFVGDNTTSASATVDIGTIRLVTSVPETGITSLIIAAAASMIVMARRRSRTAGNAS